MIIVNTPEIAGKQITKVHGLIRGNTVRAKHLGRDILAGLKNIAGGEIKSYTALMTEAREEALGRLVTEAEKAGANAVVNVRFMTAGVTAGAAEILVYGTAVTVA